MHNPDRFKSILIYQLNQIMKTRKWTQSALCQECGIGKSTINEFMCGRRQTLSFSTITQISDTLGWPIARLFMEDNMMMIPKEGGTVPDSRVPDEKSELYRRYCELFFLFPQEKAEYIVDFIEKMLCSEQEEE